MKNTEIQLNQLTAWTGNVRKTQNDAGLAELAASILAHGLLQPVMVQAEPDGNYSVVAGRRRFMALNKLAEAGNIPTDYAVSCRVIPAEADRTEISLVENVVREPMHPADEFEAFKALVDAGQSITDVAARFGVSETVVKKRLTLADVSPKIMQAYRDGEIDLAEIQAFAVNSDHAKQEAVLLSLRPNDDARDIRRYLTEGEVSANDQRVQYVTLQSYLNAGGEVRRDLFANDDRGIYILDAELLEKLVNEKLETTAEAVRAEGWKWVEIIPNLSYSDTMQMTRIYPDYAPLTAKQEKEVKKLKAEMEEIESKVNDQDDWTDEQSERHTEIENRLEQIEESRTELWLPTTLENAGAIVAINKVERGYAKREDMKSAKASGSDAAPDAPVEKQKDENALAATLIHDLTSHKSAALSAVLATRHDVALAATVYTLICSKINNSSDPMVKVNVAYTSLSLAVGEKGVSKGKAELEKLGKALKKKIPSGKKLWQWCLEADTAILLEVLAFCVAHGVDTVAQSMHRVDAGNTLAQAVGFNMAEWFTPTADNYFSRISKPQLLSAIEEMTVEPVPPSVEKMKKGELAKYAEKCAKEAATPYVPPILRPTS